MDSFKSKLSVLRCSTKISGPLFRLSVSVNIYLAHKSKRKVKLLTKNKRSDVEGIGTGSFKQKIQPEK